MSIQPFKKVRTDDSTLKQMQDAVEQPLKDLSSKVILDGLLLQGIDLVSTQTNRINHKLQRPLIGWIIVSNDSNEDIWDLQATNTRPQDFLLLECSGSCRVSLWVF